VLYLDAETGRLQAYDDIALGGLDDNEVRIRRQVALQRDPEPSPARSAR
jgi:hypothetical protein